MNIWNSLRYCMCQAVGMDIWNSSREYVSVINYKNLRTNCGTVLRSDYMRINLVTKMECSDNSYWTVPGVPDNHEQSARVNI